MKMIWQKYGFAQISATVSFHLSHWNNMHLTRSYSYQWWRQRSKGARSFQGQNFNILKPGHPDALFSSKSRLPFFSRRPLKTQRPSMLLRLFHRQNKTKWSVVRYGKIFIFCSHYCKTCFFRVPFISRIS